MTIMMTSSLTAALNELNTMVKNTKRITLYKHIWGRIRFRQYLHDVSDANPYGILFDTLYSFKDKYIKGSITVILDEVQVLNHEGNSTLVNILSRVRKLDISVILASQDYLNRSLAAVYKYCGTHILFRPFGEECIKAVAELTKLDVNTIRSFPDFCCAIMGSIYSKYNQKNVQLSSAVMGKTYRPDYVGSYFDDE